jgi:hypothetical protein
VALHGRSGGMTSLLIESDSASMPEERGVGSFGLRLVEMFTKQVNGTAAMEVGLHGRSTAVVVGPIQAEAGQRPRRSVLRGKPGRTVVPSLPSREIGALLVWSISRMSMPLNDRSARYGQRRTLSGALCSYGYTGKRLPA